MIVGGVVVIAAVAIFAAVGERHEVGGDVNAAAPSAPLLGANDPSLPPFIRKVYALEDSCRGGIGVTPDSPICKQRDAAVEQATKLHWCNGEPSQTDADSVWHECAAVEKGPIPKLHLDWIERCEDAVRNDLNDPNSADFPNPYADFGSFAHVQADQTEGGPDPSRITPAALDDWFAKHPEVSSETITFKFHAKNVFGGVQRYTASCMFGDKFDGTTKLVNHVATAD